MSDLHNSVALIQHALDRPDDPALLAAARSELDWALGEWPTSPQLLDASAALTLLEGEAA